MFPKYVSEEDISSRSSLDSSRSSSPKGDIAASPRSSSPNDNEIMELITESENIDPEMIRYYFGFDSLDKIYEFLNKDSNDKGINEGIINQTLFGLKRDINKSSKAERKNKQLKSLANIVEKILNDATNNQQGQGLKILTPKQMITRLPVLLAQLKEGNNSEKLKNEIRQIAYSLNRLKNLSKTVYNNLINTT